MDLHSNSNGNDALFELLDQMSVTDPRLQIVAKFVRNRDSLQAESIPEKERPAKTVSIASRYEQLKSENTVLMERNDVLAFALGACSDCWGEDRGCKVCGGEGSPGTYLPDKEPFVTYVLPAVRKVRLMRKDRKTPVDPTGATKS